MNSIDLRFDSRMVNYLKMVGLTMMMAVISYLAIVAFQAWLQPNIAPAMPAKKAVVSMADHLAFAFGMSETGTPGFPNPFKRHDPKKENHLNTNGRHIRNSLRGIEDNLRRNQTLRDFFRKHLSPEQYEGLTTNLDKLVVELKDSNSLLSKSFEKKIAKEILEIMERTNYIQ